MKTRIQVASDLHLEFTGMDCDLDTATEYSRDILIVAGDLAEGTNGFDWLRHQCSFSDVVFVCGNHEYYGHDIDEVDAQFRQLDERNPNFHFLQMDTIELYEIGRAHV